MTTYDDDRALVDGLGALRDEAPALAVDVPLALRRGRMLRRRRRASVGGVGAAAALALAGVVPLATGSAAVTEAASPGVVAPVPAGPTPAPGVRWGVLDTPDGGVHYFATGSGGHFARSDDGGRTWAAITLPANKENYLSPLYVLDASHLAIHSRVNEAVSSDGGRTWRTAPLATDLEADASDHTSRGLLVNAAAHTGVGRKLSGPAFCATGLGYEHSDGTVTPLASQPVSTPRLSAGIWAVPGALWYVDGIGLLCNRAGAYSPAGTYTSTDGGATWVKGGAVPRGAGFDVYPVDATHAFAVGLVFPIAKGQKAKAIVYRTSNGGRTWTAGPAQVLPGSSTQVYGGPAYPAGGSHLLTAVGGVVALSTDGGVHFAVVPSARGGVLTFAGPTSRILAVGEQGSVQVSTDGGVTFRPLGQI